MHLVLCTVVHIDKTQIIFRI